MRVRTMAHVPSSKCHTQIARVSHANALYLASDGYCTRTHTANPAGQTALGRSPVREEPQHAYTQQTLPARPHSADRQSWKSQNTHVHTQHTLPARLHSAGRQSGKSQNTHMYTHSKPCRPDCTQQVASQGRAKTHMYTHSKPCRPDCTQQVASQGRATTHIHTQQTLPSRPHLAGHRSWKSHKIRTKVPGREEADMELLLYYDRLKRQSLTQGTMNCCNFIM